MLRITLQRATGRLVLKLEGQLTGDWVAEVDTSWRAAIRAGHEPIVVDLTDVCRVDAAGHRLLANMHRAGVQFVTRGCVMPELVREISES
jgi:anti-anti-sigma regulatory factor